MLPSGKPPKQFECDTACQSLQIPTTACILMKYWAHNFQASQPGPTVKEHTVFFVFSTRNINMDINVSSLQHEICMKTITYTASIYKIINQQKFTINDT